MLRLACLFFHFFASFSISYCANVMEFQSTSYDRTLFKGLQILSTSLMSSDVNCAMSCQANDKCVGIEYLASTKQCHLVGNTPYVPVNGASLYLTNGAACPGRQFSGVCYVIQKCVAECTRVQAIAKCAAISATLAPMRSEAVFNFVHGWMGEESIPMMWVDGTDAVQEGTWKFHDGTTMTWTKWDVGEPDNDVAQDGIIIDYVTNTMWDAPKTYNYVDMLCVWE